MLSKKEIVKYLTNGYIIDYDKIIVDAVKEFGKNKILEIIDMYFCGYSEILEKKAKEKISPEFLAENLGEHELKFVSEKHVYSNYKNVIRDILKLYPYDYDELIKYL